MTIISLQQKRAYRDETKSPGQSSIDRGKILLDFTSLPILVPLQCLEFGFHAYTNLLCVVVVVLSTNKKKRPSIFNLPVTTTDKLLSS